jgi:uncharacterized OB-fold protein
MSIRVLDPVLFHPTSPPVGASPDVPLGTLIGTDATGRADLDPPVLAGSLCTRDATLVFPVQDSCPRCSGREVTSTALPMRGTLWSWTIQHFAPKSPFRGPIGDDFVPYPLGYVDLGPIIVESRLRVTDADELRIGLPMELSWLPAWTEPDGSTVLTYAFTPAGSDPRRPR